jgi:hypothetical protein
LETVEGIQNALADETPPTQANFQEADMELEHTASALLIGVGQTGGEMGVTLKGRSAIGKLME